MTETQARKEAERTRRRIDAVRFGFLGLAIILVIGLVMLLQPTVSDRTSLQIMITLPLPFGLWVVSRSLPLLAIGIFAAVVSLILGVLSISRDDDHLLLLDLTLRVGFLLITAGWIARDILQQRQISADIILGGISIYLLLGLTYALLYVMVGIGDAEAFRATDGSILRVGIDSHSLSGLPTFFYFSFSTLTTVAFGDIVPVAQGARFLTMSEGMLGQLFPAIFIGRLVGLHVAQRHSPS